MQRIPITKDFESDYLVAQLMNTQAELREAVCSLTTLLTKISQNGIAQALPKTMTSKEVAAFLHVQEGTINNWVSKRKIPFRKANGATIFLLDEILEWTKRSTAK